MFWTHHVSEPSIDESAVASLTCHQCNGVGMTWDKRLYKSVAYRTGRGTRILGQIGLVCEKCNRGIIVDVVNSSSEPLELSAIVDIYDIPLDVSSLEPVDRKKLEELQSDCQMAAFATELNILARIMRDDDVLCWYSTEFKALGGSAGYVIVRDKQVIAAVAMIQS